MLPACHRLALERVSSISRIAFAIATRNQQAAFALHIPCFGGCQHPFTSAASDATAPLPDDAQRWKRCCRWRLAGPEAPVTPKRFLPPAFVKEKKTATVPSPSGV
ncbi:hypothetical protein QT237_15615 [Geobacillus stearothermophilus]|nr:hypothetical protein QT237_15615 [Geobacillus stearothermophilus]